MGVTTEDLYGEGDGVQPATPGSYGIPPAGFRLTDATRVGPVRLQVADLGRSIAYYRDVLGLRHLDGAAGDARLGPHGDDRALVELVERPGARRADAGPHLGLFHFAILLPDRASLGRFVGHLSAIGERAGAGDHLVSEAFYLTDPDGLGIEVYADRPRDTWQRVGRELRMGTDPVDVRGVIREAGDAPWVGMPAGTVMGHVHLHVGDLEQAAAFYGDAVGFDRMVWTYPGALFLGAGGYHHHLGTNTWAGPRALPPAEDDAQLVAWTLELGDEAAVEALRSNLDATGQPVSWTTDGGLETRDPWGTVLRVQRAERPVSGEMR